MPKKPKNSQEPSTATGADAGTQPAVIIPKNIRTIETTVPTTNICAVFNARTEFDERYIREELKPSIEQWGIQNRLWVYPLETPGPKGEEYGLIAGECRWRAAQLIPLLEVPVKMFECSRNQAIELGLIDNIQRQNLTEVDEAFGYKKLIDECGYKAWDPADPEHSVGHKLGKSKTKVYSLLKLVELPKLGLEAVRSGQLSASVAVRIARIPTKKAQMEALKSAISDSWTDAEAAEYIAEDYMTELKGAPFDRKDTKLVPDRGSCDACPLRSGNQAEMFTDMGTGRGDLCTDPTCFRRKCSVAFDKRSIAHRDSGGRVLTKKEAERAGLHDSYSSVGGGYAELTGNAYQVGEYNKTWKQLLKPVIEAGEFIPVLAMANDGSGKHFELVEISEVKPLLKKHGLLKKERSESSESQREARAEEKLNLSIRRAQVDAIVNGYDLMVADARAEVICNWLRLVAIGFIDHISNDRAREICKRRGLEVQKLHEHGDFRGTLRELAAKIWSFQGAMSFITDLLICCGHWNAEKDAIAAFAGLVQVNLQEISNGVRLAAKGKSKGAKKAKGQDELGDMRPFVMDGARVLILDRFEMGNLICVDPFRADASAAGLYFHRSAFTELTPANPEYVRSQYQIFELEAPSNIEKRCTKQVKAAIHKLAGKSPKPQAPAEHELAEAI